MAFPVSPVNIGLYNPGTQWAFDLTWDDPSLLPENGFFVVKGVNIYRAYDDPKGSYIRVNKNPVTVGYYRDANEVSLVQEDVSTKFLTKGKSPNSEWIFKVDNIPMVINDAVDTEVTNGRDVSVVIDGTEVKPLKVLGHQGHVYLNTFLYYDHRTKRNIEPLLPSENSTVVCKYYYNSNYVSISLNKRVYYKLTTVGSDDEGLKETPLDACIAINSDVINEVDPVWQEAMGRNGYILEQGGEMVKLFLRKWAGDRCESFYPTHQQSTNDCKICFGTGWVGGYTGPYDISIASPDAPKSLEATDLGLKPTFQFDTWTGQTPLISQRDFVVRKNGDRFAVGAVSLSVVGGTPLQQQFSLSLIQTKDIRYFVPLDGKLVIPPNANPPTPPTKEQIAARKKVWEEIL